MPKNYGRPFTIQSIIRRQENLAMDLLDNALAANVPVDIKLDVFDRVSKYLAVKNRIEDQEETDIDRFKKRIHGTETEAPKGRKLRAERVTAPERLAGIKEKLSGGGHSGPDGNSGDSGEQVPAASGG